MAQGAKITRPNQHSVYLNDDTQEELREFMSNYPLLPFSMIVNAGLRFYFKAAKDGIDGNLQPLSK